MNYERETSLSDFSPGNTLSPPWDQPGVTAGVIGRQEQERQKAMVGAQRAILSGDPAGRDKPMLDIMVDSLNQNLAEIAVLMDRAEHAADRISGPVPQPQGEGNEAIHPGNIIARLERLCVLSRMMINRFSSTVERIEGAV